MVQGRLCDVSVECASPSAVQRALYALAAHHTSLAHAQFNGLYEAAIDGAERAVLPAKRIAAIINHMTFEIYKYIQRGLFERHKLIFAWMLTASILLSAGKACPPPHQAPGAGSSCMSRPNTVPFRLPGPACMFHEA